MQQTLMKGQLRKSKNTKNKSICTSLIQKGNSCIDHVNLWNVLRKMRISEHLIILVQKQYTSQETTICTEPDERDQLQLGEDMG